jgi:nucleotide-binding universal stress UspA family protein
MATSAFRTILVALDGSAAAQATLGLALRLAGAGCTLLLAHAIDRGTIVAECSSPYGGNPEPALEALEADQREILSAGASRAAAAGIAFETVALDGNPAREIAALARERGVDAIVMGTHGRRGLARIVLGSTAAGVLHATAVPTFVTHEETAGRDAALRTILVAVDASPAGEEAARFAIDFAQQNGASVVLTHVVEKPDEGEPFEVLALFERMRTYALAAGVLTETHIVQGDPVDAILSSAEAYRADLIATGIHSRSAIVRLFLGSVAEAIVRSSPIPVVVLPARAGAPVHASTA